jgi:hypothetical protein
VQSKLNTSGVLFKKVLLDNVTQWPTKRETSHTKSCFESTSIKQQPKAELSDWTTHTKAYLNKLVNEAPFTEVSTGQQQQPTIDGSWHTESLSTCPGNPVRSIYCRRIVIYVCSMCYSVRCLLLD